MQPQYCSALIDAFKSRSGMASEVVCDLADTVIDSDPGVVANLADEVIVNSEDSRSTSSAETVVIRARDSAYTNQLASNSYVLANNHSIFSRDVDHWIRGNFSPSTDTGVQGSRAYVPMMQRSTLVNNSSSLAATGTGVWYILAIALPFLSDNNRMLSQWRCTPSTVLSSLELLFYQLANFCGQSRNVLRQLAHEQLSRDVFATAMDILLVFYAIGFLLLSMYQASLIG